MVRHGGMDRGPATPPYARPVARARRGGARGAGEAPGLDVPLLERLGVRVGEAVRFRRRPGGHWCEGVVTGLERDGSLGVRDADGRARALLPEAVEVRRDGPRGARRWEPLVDRAARSDQLSLWD
jgi:hypothetical protein